MKNRIFAILASGLMLSSASAMPTVQAEDRLGYDSLIGKLPSWTPMSFVDAMKFYNKHGKCYLADNYICMVRPIPKNKTDQYGYSISGSMTNVNTPASPGNRIYELEIPEEPDPDDIEAVDEYNFYCDSVGNYSHEQSFFDDYLASDEQYVFDVEMFRVLDGLDLNIMCYEMEGEEYKITDKYSFENHDGTTVQTDIYSWLPDSTKELQDYIYDHGDVSVHDSYVILLSQVNAAAGESLIMRQEGEGAFEEYLTSVCDNFEIFPMDGVSPPAAILYKPTADGKVDIEWRKGFRDDDTENYFFDGKYEIKENCTVIDDRSPFRKGNTVFTFIDKATGNPVYKKYLSGFTGETPDGEQMTSETFQITDNPLTVDSINAYKPGWHYFFYAASKSGCYENPEFEVTGEDNGTVYVTCKVEWQAYGDANADGKLTVADAVILEKWLLGAKDVSPIDWNAMDLCRDCNIDVFDYCLLRQKLIDRKELIAEPEFPVYPTTSAMFRITGDDFNVYSGPGTAYPIVNTWPDGDWLYEMGYNDGNDEWVYTEYNNIRGWVRLISSDDKTANIEWAELAYDKPVIYLYPEEKTDVHVELDLTTSDLATTYPKYNGGWDVTAYPDGSLLNKADGTHHRYLFWDSTNARTAFDLSKGFCVAGSDTEAFLREKLTYMGLSEEEMNEFIVYWLPRMEHNAYNLITFQGDAYTDSAKLDITPSPDSLLRIFMVYMPLENAVDIQPQQLETFERKGFTVVEWGGTELG
ncbi:MAG: hypothetical protein J5501_09385 [Ruminococcus sp.]|nr:hypothetical protein [Ruminococcus sp.]